MNAAFITGADRGLGLAMTRRLAEQGWHVFAGSYLKNWSELDELANMHRERITIVELDVSSDQSVKSAAELVSSRTQRLDMLINNAGISGVHKDVTIYGNQDYDELRQVYNVNALGMLRVTHELLPLVGQSKLKRLIYISSEAGSISECQREAWYGYCMSKAALNLAVARLFHSLRPQGYTFRLFHPGWMKTYMSGKKNMNAELEPDHVAKIALSYFINPRLKAGEQAEDEDTLLMRDWSGRDWPW